MPDVMLTGLPRAGATAVMALMDSLPDTVCLNAPQWQADLRKLKHPLAYCKWLTGDFIYRRVQLLHGEAVPDWRAADGSPLWDGMRDPRQPVDAEGKRIPYNLTRSGLSENFTLVMKHHSLYTGLLPTLVGFEHFAIIAIIRHPLDVLTSWASFPGTLFASGQMEDNLLWPEAQKLSETDLQPLIRMVQLYDLHLGIYHELHKKIRIVKYEEVLENPALVAMLLGKKEPSAGTEFLTPPSPRRFSGDIDALRDAFRRYGVYTRQYYPDIDYIPV